MKLYLQDRITNYLWVQIPLNSMVEKGRIRLSHVSGNRKAFDVTELPERLKVRFCTYMVIEDIKLWW